MKTNKRRITALLLAVFLIASIFSIGGIDAADGVEIVTFDEDNWVSAWSTSPVDASLAVNLIDKLGVPVYNTTSRVSIEPTMSGSRLRLVFSNEYGVLPLNIGACSVATTNSKLRSIETETTVNVTFDGKTSVKIPAGKKITCDPIDFEVTAGKNITISTYYSGLNVMKTVGLIGGHSFLVSGNATKKKTVNSIELSVRADSGAYEIIPSLIEADVLSSDPTAQTCVIYGDSTVSNEVPRYFAERLWENGIYNVSITQAAIKGNRLVENGVGAIGRLLGAASVKRFEKDALSQAGVKTVIVKIGANDIIHPYCKSFKDKLTPVTLDEMIEGYTTLVEQAHERGIKIYFCEVAPWKGYTRSLLKKGDDVEWTPEIDRIRLEINEWLSGEDCPADGFISLPSITDPDDPYALISRYTTDGAHFTTEGAEALAQALPIALFD